jgi:hypothetical protein
MCNELCMSELLFHCVEKGALSNDGHAVEEMSQETHVMTCSSFRLPKTRSSQKVTTVVLFTMKLDLLLLYVRVPTAVQQHS